MKVLFLQIFITLLSIFSLSQEKILLVDGFLHIGNGETINQSLIGIENGKIIFVKKCINI